MKHLFIPYELAVIAKEKGFDEPCFTYWRTLAKEKVIAFSDIDQHGYLNHTDGNTIAPLYQQIIDWFRENHNLCIEVSEWSKHFSGKVKPIGKGIILQTKNYDVYYQTLTKAIEEAFKLI